MAAVCRLAQCLQPADVVRAAEWRWNACYGYCSRDDPKLAFLPEKAGCYTVQHSSQIDNGLVMF